MKTKFLNGKRTLRIGLMYGKSPPTRNYCFHFFRNGIPVAMVHYHHGAKQLVVNPLDVCLTQETLVGLGQYLDMIVFRRQRRKAMSGIRWAKVKARKDTPQC